MAYELRREVFDFSGYLASAIGIDTATITLKGNLAANLPTDYSNASYLPLTIADDNAGRSEIVWVTSHASASPTLGVLRGREGTTPLAWDQGVNVRCSPTIRDVVAPYASRSALPSDAHIGMRGLLLDERIVVERTLFGWSDSTSANDPARKHRWNQSGAATATGGVLISGLSGGQTNTTGKYATMSNGALLLNQPGEWTVGLCMYGTSQSARNQGVEMRWPDGAFPGGIGSLFDIKGVQGGTSPAGNGLNMVMWEGYVPAAAAAKPISMYASTTVALTGCVYDVFAEYKGQ